MTLELLRLSVALCHSMFAKSYTPNLTMNFYKYTFIAQLKKFMYNHQSYELAYFSQDYLIQNVKYKSFAQRLPSVENWEYGCIFKVKKTGEKKKKD